MKHSKFFIFSIFVLIITVFIEMQDFVYSRSVEKGLSLKKQEELWNGLIADSVNQKKIYISVDGQYLELERGEVYMDENLNLMIPATFLNKYFNCSARLYDGKKLLIQQNTTTIQMNLGERVMSVNEKKRELNSPATMVGNQIYLSIETLQEVLNCQYNWNMNLNSAEIIQTSESKKLPAQYDYRLLERAPGIKDQGKYGTCWAFASLTSLESSLLPEREFDFSEDHMSLQNSFAAEINDGGEYTMAIAYLASWQGPVLEEEDPYGDGISPEGLEAACHVQEVQIIGAKDFETIKEMVFKYGGVQTSLYTSLINSQSRSEYYNPETYAYCYIGTEKPNHDVVIIGWDDDYSKENFTMNLEADGAFICRNSWGSEFGNNGTFYVSYYDSNIGTHNVVFSGVEDVDNYDRIYQSDYCGWVGQLGYGSEKGYFANVYTTKEAEQLAAVGFYATGKNTEYEIFVVHDFKGMESFAERISVKEGKFKNAGYYTVELKEGIDFRKGERFAVVVKIQTPGSERPIAIEYAADEATKEVDISDGEGYISLYGKSWDNTESTQGCNICLKAFTKVITKISENREENMEKLIQIW